MDQQWFRQSFNWCMVDNWRLPYQHVDSEIEVLLTEVDMEAIEVCDQDNSNYTQ